MTDRIYFYLVTSGSSLTQSRVPTSAFPRICDSGDIYLYRIPGKLLVSRDAGFTWSNIIASGMGSVSAMALTVETSATLGSASTVTYTINSSMARYHTVPETGAWSSGSTPPANFVPETAAADLAGTVGILVGNIHSGVESRIVGAFEGAPFSLVDADTGIPQTSGSVGLITCIEMCS